MKNFQLLYALSFKNYFAKNPNAKSSKYRSIQYGALGVLLALIVVGMCAAIYFLGSIFPDSKGVEYVVSTVLMASQLFVLFQGIATTLSVLFFSKDNEFLSALPIKPHEIFLSKISMIFTTNLALSTTILLPVLVTLGISTKMGFQYYLITPLALIFTPMIPLFIISIFSMPIIVIARAFKRSSIASLIAMIVAYMGFMAVYFGVVLGVSGNADIVVDMESAIDSIINSLRIASYIIYPNLFISRAMVGSNIGFNLPIYLVVMVAVGVIAIVLSSFFYGKITAYNSQGVVVKHKARSRSKISGAISSLVKNDMLNLSRQPSLMFNSIIGLLIVPFITALFSMGATSAIGAMMFPIFGCGMNYFALIAVSRDREKLFITKYLPVSPRQFVTSKLIISSVYVVALALVVMICFFIMQFNIIEVLLCTLMILGLGFAISAIAIKQDFKKPNMTWNTMKELTNGGKALFYVLGSMVFGMVLSIGAPILGTMLGETAIMIGLLVIDLIVFALALVVHYDLLRSADKMYYDISATNG